MWGLHGQSADALLRYEALSADLEAVLSERGVDMPGLPRANVSDARDGRHYAEFYDDDSRLYIAERFAGEIAELGYSFGTEACVAG